MWCFLLLTLFVTVQGRAVNISNTWVLPEEGFPVFYRYFRDRISWYEADAVCQFHHANLVTVDTTAQYDAVRAYLKELDISSAVWVGLIRSNPDGDFTWTDYRGLSSDGYWSSAPDARSAPLCAAADPTADYRWEARACGGPSVASFICELPVPQWALGNEGCMVRALPALTILYLPESAAVQLTADCGLAGVKRVQCTGNMKRENLLKDLSCTDDDQTSTLSMPTSPATFWQTTTDKVISDQEYINEVTSDDNSTTEHEDDINQSTSTKLLPSADFVLSTTENNLPKQSVTVKQIFKVPLQKNLNFNIITDNNLHSNDIPNPAGSNDFFSNEQTEILEDEKNMQHKKLHDELARLGNFETIFSQPTDHFVPPLVMAKAKISDDMTALSIEEKLAQQLAERQFMRHNNLQSDSAEMNNDTQTGSAETVLKEMMTENPLINVLSSTKTTDVKYGVPKKYNKHDDIKLKTVKQNQKSLVPIKISNFETSTQSNLTADNSDLKATIKTITQKTYAYDDQKSDNDSSLELTVIIKEPAHSIDINKTKMIGPNFNISEMHEKSMNIKKSVSSVPTGRHVIMNDEVIKIEIINEKGNNHSDIDITVYEVTTKIPVLKENPNMNESMNLNISQHDFISMPTTFKPTTQNDSTFSSVNDLITASIRNSVTDNMNKLEDGKSTERSLITVITDLNVDSSNDSIFDYTARNVFDDILPSNISIKETNDSLNDTDLIEHLEINDTRQTPEIDDLNSPLLSAASEPLHKPNRSRRPQSQNRVTKFNPFRILG